MIRAKKVLILLIACFSSQFIYTMRNEIASVAKPELWFFQQECRPLIELTNTCTTIHDQSLNEEAGVSVEYFKKVEELLQNKEITIQNLIERRLASRFVQIPDNAPPYIIDYTFLHVLVLSKAPLAIAPKKNALKAYCDRFGENAYQLLHLEDTSGRKLLHLMFEKGDEASTSVFTSMVIDCARRKNMLSLISEIVQEKEAFSLQCTPIDCAYYYNNEDAMSALILRLEKEKFTDLITTLLERLSNKK
jgi:hypothetical protein